MTTSPRSTAPDPAAAPPSPRRLLTLFLLAWAPRLALALVFLRLPIALDDMYQYDMLALSLARGDGYRWYQRDYVQGLRAYFERAYNIELEPGTIPVDGFATVFRAPGYPAFLAVVYRIAGEAQRIAAARLVQSALGAALAPLTALLAYRLRLPPRAGTAAAVVVGLYPILWMYPLGLGSENLFLLLSTAGVLLLLRAGADGRAPSAFLAGLILGAAAMTRGALAPFLVFGAAWLARRAGGRAVAAFAVAAAALIVPWSVRNSLVLGRPAFIENSFGYNLFVGAHPEGDGGFDAAIAYLPTRYLDDGERDRWSLEQALAFLRADPWEAVARLPRRLAYLAGFETRELIFIYSNGFFGPIASPILVGLYLLLVLPWIVVAAGAPFAMAAAQDRGARDLVLWFVAATLLVYLPILAEPRFHLPLVPLLAPYAAAAWLRPRLFAPAPSAAYRLALTSLVLLVGLWTWDFVRQASRTIAVLSPGGHALRLEY